MTDCPGTMSFEWAVGVHHMTETVRTSVREASDVTVTATLAAVNAAVRAKSLAVRIMRTPKVDLPWLPASPGHG